MGIYGHSMQNEERVKFDVSSRHPTLLRLVSVRYERGVKILTNRSREVPPRDSSLRSPNSTYLNEGVSRAFLFFFARWARPRPPVRVPVQQRTRVRERGKWEKIQQKRQEDILFDGLVRRICNSSEDNPFGAGATSLRFEAEIFLFFFVSFRPVGTVDSRNSTGRDIGSVGKRRNAPNAGTCSSRTFLSR